MMEFDDNKPIYRQIADYAYDNIIDGIWRSGDRIPSVRELAALMGVNTRTVMKAMEEMQHLGIVIQRRGMGSILAEDAKEKVKSLRTAEFFRQTLPRLKADMMRLGISPESLMDALEHFS